MFLNLTERIVSNFSILRLLVLSLIVHFLFLLFLPTTPSFLAPDEGNYEAVTSRAAESIFADESPGVSSGLYYTSRTLILPAAALAQSGLDSLTAVRVISIIYGLLSIYFFTKIVFLILEVKSIKDLSRNFSRNATFCAIALFAFLPSRFVWSTLGLRESASQATILASVFFLLKLCETNRCKRGLLKTALATTFPILTITLSFGARKQTAFVFVVSFCIILLSMRGRKKLPHLLSIIILGSILGAIYSSTPIYKDGQKYLSTSEVLSQLRINGIDQLETIREGNRVGARTALSGTTCTNYSQLSIQNVICNAKEFPYRITSFLIRPLPIMDSGSLVNNLASAENIIWILLLLTFAYCVIVSIQNKFKLEVIIPTTLFIIFFSSSAALYEGNLGTAFRHKSTILWGLLLVIAIGMNGNWRTPEEVREQDNPRYSS